MDMGSHLSICFLIQLLIREAIFLKKRTVSRVLAACTVTALFLFPTPAVASPVDSLGDGSLLTDPILQAPAVGQVNAVWFTETPGTTHVALTGDIENLTAEQAAAAARGDVAGVTAFAASTTQLLRMREDADSFVDNGPNTMVERDVYRHEATITGLPKTGRTPYRVVSLDDDQVALSHVFTAQDAFEPDEHVNMLLTSDHQQKNNTTANMYWAAQILGPIDVTLFAGDLINHPDRASEWFDDNRGLGFFPGLQGNSTYVAENGRVYPGGEIVQNAVLYPVIGNHEVQGRIDGFDSLNESFTSPVPREVAEAEYEKVAAEVNPANDPQVKQQWIEDNSFSTTSYEEIFTLPESPTGGEKYYATTIGNTRLISLYSTRIWRDATAEADPAAREVNSRFHDAADVVDKPLERGYGEFIFEDLAVDSAQYNWLKDELASAETTGAENVIVMLHESPHGIGDNVMPHFANPVETPEFDDEGNVIGYRYDYPTEDNILMNSLMPLIDHENTPVDLVFNGHSHLWNRFKSPHGVNYIETSNVGNSYGAFHPLSDSGERPGPGKPWNPDYHMPQGTPGGLEPIVPTEKPFMSANDPLQPAPYVTSNRYSVFTGFNTETGLVTSYIFDSENPDEAPQKLDEFSLHDEAPADASSATSALSSGDGSSTGVLGALVAVLP